MIAVKYTEEFMEKKTILVVGGAGFIGSYVNKLLSQSGYNTFVFDNLSSGQKSNVVAGTFFLGNLCNPQDLEDVFSKNRIDAVMHFAAYIKVGESVDNPLKYYENNVCGTLNLLKAMLRYNVKTFVFSSSAAIFGNPNKTLIDENHAQCPINPYGESKLIVEKILQDCDKAYGLKSCCLRYFNAAGGDPERKIKTHQKDSSNLIPIILNSLLNPKGSVTIFGTDYPTPDGTCIRDYIHIHDLAQAHILGMEKLLSGTSSLNYNLGNGKGFSVLEVIAAVEKVTGRSVNAIKGSRRMGDPPMLVANAEKAHLELGWNPQHPSLEVIIDHAWKSMQ